VPKYREVKIKKITIAETMTNIYVYRLDQRRDIWLLNTINSRHEERTVLEGVTKKQIWEWLMKNVKPRDIVSWIGYDPPIA
jgi:hypothetical protein